MTSFTDITKLRKEGKLAEAFQKAESMVAEEPDNIWSKRAMMWVVYDYAKLNASPEKRNAFLRCIEKISELHVPSDEDVFLYAALGVIRNSVRKCVGDPTSSSFITSLWNEIAQWDLPKPSEIYSSVLQTFLKVKDQWLDFMKFCRWWDFSYLRSNDFEVPELPEGKKDLPLAEKAYMAYSKALLLHGDRAEINEWLPTLELLCQKHRQYIYLPYYHIKLIIANGGSDTQVENHLKPLLRKKPNEFWIWELIADSMKEPEQRFSALCKAMACRAPEKMTIALRERMAIALYERGCYSESRFEFEEVVRIRAQNKWRISPQVNRYRDTVEITKAHPKKNNFKFYQEHSRWAEDTFLGAASPITAIVVHVNTDKGFISFSAGGSKTGFFKERNAKRLQTVSKGDTIEIMMVKMEMQKPSQIRSWRKIVPTTRPKRPAEPFK